MTQIIVFILCFAFLTTSALKGWADAVDMAKSNTPRRLLAYGGIFLVVVCASIILGIFVFNKAGE